MNCYEHILMNTIIYQMKKDEQMNSKYKPKKSFIKGHNYNDSCENVELSNKKEAFDQEKSVDLSDMPPLEGNGEEVKEGKGLKVLTPKKLLAKLPILLAQIKAGNNSYKLENETRQILYPLYQHNKINQRFTTDPKTFSFNFDWPKDIDENLKHEIEFIIKSNESLAGNKIKPEIEQLLLKYKYGNNIHEHRKQQNRMSHINLL